MDDLINRKAAIDVIMDADVCVTWNGVISDDDAVDIAIKSTKGSVISSIVNLPSAQPEKRTDKCTETHSCDCISRQAAIDAIKGEIEINGYSHVVDVLEQLPSAQPETHDKRTKTHACDLIDRQDAIDAITRKMVSIPTAGEKDLMGDVNRIRAEDISVIKRLPSAQPEIVLCKDCVKRNRKLGSLDEHYNRYNKSQCCPMIEFRGMPRGHEFDYQYCSWAERRTDGN